MAVAFPDGFGVGGTQVIWWFPKIRGTFLGCPHNKDYSILGSILGSPDFGKVPYRDHGNANAEENGEWKLCFYGI